jgi:hypothetical protein
MLTVVFALCPGLALRWLTIPKPIIGPLSVFLIGPVTKKNFYLLM